MEEQVTERIHLMEIYSELFKNQENSQGAQSMTKDASNPFFLSNNDHPGLSHISHQLSVETIR